MAKVKTRGMSTTEMVLLPTVKGPAMDKLREVLKASAAKSRGRRLGCGECDQYIGIAWCNASVPGGKYKLTILREL